MKTYEIIVLSDGQVGKTWFSYLKVTSSILADILLVELVTQVFHVRLLHNIEIITNY